MLSHAKMLLGLQAGPQAHVMLYTTISYVLVMDRILSKPE